MLVQSPPAARNSATRASSSVAMKQM
jgi:hypothetical protein